MMQGETVGVRVRLPDPALRVDLGDFFHRWGCVTYEVGDDTLEVIVPDAPAERQGSESDSAISRTWFAQRSILPTSPAPLRGAGLVSAAFS